VALEWKKINGMGVCGRVDSVGDYHWPGTMGVGHCLGDRLTLQPKRVVYEVTLQRMLVGGIEEQCLAEKMCREVEP